VLCNVENAQVVVVPSSDFVQGKTTPKSVRDAYATSGTRLLHDKAANMLFVDDGVRARLQLIAGFTCPKYVSVLLAGDAPIDAVGGDLAGAACGTPSHRTVGAMRAHVREQHGAALCDVCVASKVEYKSMLHVYPIDAGGGGRKSAKLQEHVRNDHPPCRFCGTHFLDDNELFEHLQKNHEACHICERAGRLHEYFRNFSTLEAHYRSQHFVCDDLSCRGVVFASVLDLQAHTLQRHRNELPRNARGRRMQVNLAELHAPVTSAGRGGRGGRGGARGGEGRDAVAVHGVRHGPDHLAPERVVPPPALMSEDDVRQEQELQAARRREFMSSRVVFSSEVSSSTNAAPSRNASERQVDPANAHSSSSTGDDASRAASSTLNVFANTAAGSGGHQSHITHAGTSVRSDGVVRESSTLEHTTPDDGAFYERRFPTISDEISSRNKALVAHMRAALDPAAFEQFRTFSGDFRNARMSAEDYYDATVDCFGVRSAVRNILPELTALLPNARLRSELTAVCLRRHPRPLTATSRQVPGTSSAPSVSARPSGQLQPRAPAVPLSSSIDTFPSLIGGSAAPPVRASAPRMRVAPPKAVDFPHLRGGSTSTPPAAPLQRSQTSAPVMQPSLNRIFGEAAPIVGNNQTIVTPTTAAGAGLPPPLAESAFPSLSSGLSAGAASAERLSSRQGMVPKMQGRLQQDFPSLVAPGASQSGHEAPVEVSTMQDADRSEPAPEVLDRAGAVWGGAGAARVHGGKKRGPGRGSVPAPLPEGYDPRPVRSGPVPSTHVPDDTSNIAGGSGSSTGARVIDVSALSLSRQAKSALPRVSAGGSYGFAWERKKIRNKQREIKREVTSQLATSASTTAPHPSYGFRPEGAPTVQSNIAAPCEVPNEVVSEQEKNVDKSWDSSSSPAPEFDQFSYLSAGTRGVNGNGDPASSFFNS
jgi:hypothetical protein